MRAPPASDTITTAPPQVDRGLSESGVESCPGATVVPNCQPKLDGCHPLHRLDRPASHGRDRTASKRAPARSPPTTARTHEGCAPWPRVPSRPPYGSPTRPAWSAPPPARAAAPARTWPPHARRRVPDGYGCPSHTPHVVAPARTSRPHPLHAPAPQCSPSAARPSTAPPVSSPSRAARRRARSSSRNRAHARPPCSSLPSSAHPAHPHNAASSPAGSGHDTTSANRHRSPPSVHSHPFRFVCAGSNPIVPGALARAAHHASTTSRACSGTNPAAHPATTATGSRASRARAHCAASRQPYPNARASVHNPSTPPRSPDPDTAQTYAAAVGSLTCRRTGDRPGVMFSSPTRAIPGRPCRLDALARTPRQRPRSSAGRSTAATPRARCCQGRDPVEGRGAGCWREGGGSVAGS
jgi:hypothetical protein